VIYVHDAEPESVVGDHALTGKKRVHRVLAHYEDQTEEEAVAEDEAAYDDPNQAMIEIPRELIPAVRELIAKAGLTSRCSRRGPRRR